MCVCHVQKINICVCVYFDKFQFETHTNKMFIISCNCRVAHTHSWLLITNKKGNHFWFIVRVIRTKSVACYTAIWLHLFECVRACVCFSFSKLTTWSVKVEIMTRVNPSGRTIWNRWKKYYKIKRKKNDIDCFSKSKSTCQSVIWNIWSDNFLHIMRW